MYKPKESVRWRPKVVLPICLKEQCLNVAVDWLSRTATGMSRNTREKKGVREYLHNNLPVFLQKEILEKAVGRLVGVQTTLSLLDIFEPKNVAKESVNLLGPFRMGFGCYLRDGRLTWSQGSAKKFNLSQSQLDQLYNILLWSNPSQLKELTISISRDSIGLSKLPNILARGKELTTITLLSGAENHTMRIIGVSCPSIRHLDVSHSVRITDQGLRNLLLKRPPRRQSTLSRFGGPGSMSESESSMDNETMAELFQERNPCAESLITITLLGTSVTWIGCDQACHLMTFSYLYSSLPLIKIKKIVNPRGTYEKGLILNRRTHTFATPSRLDEDMKFLLGSAIDNIIDTDDFEYPVVDIYQLPKRNQTDDTRSLVFVRKLDCFKLSFHMKMNGNMITSLILPWYTFTWKLDTLVNLETLGLSFPNLRFLRGRIRGTWNRHDVKFMPHLQYSCVWSLNCTTGMSILENAPSLKVFEFNNTQTLAVSDTRFELTDETLQECLLANMAAVSSLEEIIIRPCGLTVESLYFLISNCKNLKRVGDLESWNVSTEQIADFNRYLDSTRSQCVISVMNFPPTSPETIEWV